jgi:ADP-ribose pyrophosphatase YjhB (NUDIX family)
MPSSLLTTQRAMLALIQSGLAYTTDPFDKDRYQKLQTLLIQQMAAAANVATADLTAALTQDSGYITPKIDVRGLIRHGNQLLLVQDIKTKLWALPGGFADVGYTPTENVQREVWEETGRHVAVQGLITVLTLLYVSIFPNHFSIINWSLLVKLLMANLSLTLRSPKQPTLHSTTCHRCPKTGRPKNS